MFSCFCYCCCHRCFSLFFVFVLCWGLFYKSLSIYNFKIVSQSLVSSQIMQTIKSIICYLTTLCAAWFNFFLHARCVTWDFQVFRGTRLTIICFDPHGVTKNGAIVLWPEEGGYWMPKWGIVTILHYILLHFRLEATLRVHRRYFKGSLCRHCLNKNA